MPLHNKQLSTFYSTHSYCPWRWLAQVAASQCCCCYGILVSHQSERVSRQAAVITAAHHCNLDGSGTRPCGGLVNGSVACDSCPRWIINFVMLFVSFFSSHFLLFFLHDVPLTKLSAYVYYLLKNCPIMSPPAFPVLTFQAVFVNYHHNMICLITASTLPLAVGH